MNIDFIQGIVTYPTSDNDQKFLEKVGNYVTLVTDVGSVDLTIAHGISNYLVTESASVPNAWGPLLPSTQYWLYIDIHKISGMRTFGFTSIEPITSNSSHIKPIDGQHWFNTAANKMYVSNGSNWTELIRVFVASVVDSTFSPLGSGFLKNPYAGSQVRLSAIPGIETYPILRDDTGKPLAHADGRLFTTADRLFVPKTPFNPLRMESNIVTAVASVNLVKYQVVKYIRLDTIAVATYNDAELAVVGIALQDAQVGDTITICIQGHIINPAWTFSTVNQPLWIGTNGELTSINQHKINSSGYPTDRLHVARVLSPTSIVFNENMVSGGDPSAQDLTNRGSILFTELLDGPGRNSLVNEGQSVWAWRSTSLVRKNESGLVIKSSDAVVPDSVARIPSLIDVVGSSSGGELDVFRVNSTSIKNAIRSTIGIDRSGKLYVNADDSNINSAEITHIRSPGSLNNPGILIPSVRPATIKVIMLARGSFPFEVDNSLKNPNDINGKLFPIQPVNSIWNIRGRIASGVNSDVYCAEFNLTCVRTNTVYTIVSNKSTVLTSTDAYKLSSIDCVITNDSTLQVKIKNAPDDANSALSVCITQIGTVAGFVPVVIPIPSLVGFEGVPVVIPSPSVVSIEGTLYVAPLNEFVTSAIYGNLIEDILHLTSSTLINSSLISIPTDAMTLGSSAIDSGTLLETVVYLSPIITEPSTLELGIATIDTGTLQQTISYASVNVSDSSTLLLNSASIESASLVETVSYLQYSITDPSKLTVNLSTITSGTLA